MDTTRAISEGTGEKDTKKALEFRRKEVTLEIKKYLSFGNSHIQVLKEQAKNSKLKGDLMNMEAVLEWESYFGQVNLSTRRKTASHWYTCQLSEFFCTYIVSLKISITS